MQGSVGPAHSVGQTCFFTLVTDRGEWRARLFIESLRAFGGPLKDCPVWVFHVGVEQVPDLCRDMAGVRCIPLALDEELGGYFFAAKVSACAQAEELADPGAHSLVWVNPSCLIVNPPLLFDLRPSFDAAFRTVHHRNVGSLVGEPLDDFWQAVYRMVGIEEAPFTITSFVDRQAIRPYFNTHCFAIDPTKGICRAWLEYFRAMVLDRAFQAGPGRDQLYQIFVHQAILSALVAKELPQERIRLLPLEYSYPLHMHGQVPAARRAKALRDLVCPVYEEELVLEGLSVDESLSSWLAARLPRSESKQKG